VRFTSDEQRKAVMARMHHGPSLAAGIGVGLGARAYLRRRATTLSKGVRRTMEEMRFLRQGYQTADESVFPALQKAITARRSTLVPALKKARHLRTAGKVALVGGALIGYGASRLITQSRKRQAIATHTGPTRTYGVLIPRVHPAPVAPVHYAETKVVPAFQSYMDNAERKRRYERISRVIKKLHGVEG